MISTSVISFLFGTVLGQRATVIGLIPAMGAIVILALAAGVAHPDAAWGLVKVTASAGICLQFGYFAGVIIWPLLTAARSGRSSADRSARQALR